MNIQLFESHKYTWEFGSEFWTARDLSKILWYSDYRNFLKVIEKAKISCKHSQQKISDHFVEFNDLIEMWKWAKRKIQDFKLSRYACYLIVQNADPSKEVVAIGQNYFAIQTRRQEYKDSLEDQKRVELRNEIKEHNKELFKTARRAGVTDYGEFYDAWYLWMYGLRKRDLTGIKWLKSKDNMFDYMNSEELAANLFRATQAESKIKRESVKWQKDAEKAHEDVWKEVRDAIKKIWWTMPEKLPIADDIKEAKKRLEYLQEWKPIPVEMKQVEQAAKQEPFNKNKFEMPSTIIKIEKIKNIITQNKWNIVIEIGSYTFKVNDTWLSQLKEFLSPKI